MSIWDNLKKWARPFISGFAPQLTPKQVSAKVRECRERLNQGANNQGGHRGQLVAETSAVLREIGPVAATDLLEWLQEQPAEWNRESPDTPWFEVAARLLAEWHELRAVPYLMRTIQIRKKSFIFDFHHACEALGTLQCREAIEPLRRVMPESIMALARLHDVESLPLIVPFLEQSGKPCAVAAFALCELTPETAFDRISSRIKRGGFQLSDEVAKSLARIAPDRAFDLLVEALGHPGNGLWRGAAEVLAELDPKRAFDAVSAAIRHPHHAAHHDIALLEGVRRLDEQRYRQELRWGLEHGNSNFPSGEDRWYEAISREKLTPADVDMFFRLASPDVLPSIAQGDALAKTGDLRAIQLFEGWLHHKQACGAARSLLIKGIGQLNRPECVAALLKVMEMQTERMKSDLVGPGSREACQQLLKVVPANIQKISQADLESLTRCSAVEGITSSDSDFNYGYKNVDCSELHKIAQTELDRRRKQTPAQR